MALDPPEEANFNGLFGGYHFNPLGMCCPVRSCPVTVLFPSHGLYLKHYRVWHLPTLLKWSCNTCERVFGSKQNKRAHRFCHTFFLFHIPSLKYINPGEGAFAHGQVCESHWDIFISTVTASAGAITSETAGI